MFTNDKFQSYIVNKLKYREWLIDSVQGNVMYARNEITCKIYIDYLK